jgi:hypothetical protein
MYIINVLQTEDNNNSKINVDGNDQFDNVVHLVNDEKEHSVQVTVCFETSIQNTMHAV